MQEIEQLLAEHICVGLCKGNFTVLEFTGPIRTESDHRKERYKSKKKCYKSYYIEEQKKEKCIELVERYNIAPDKANDFMASDKTDNSLAKKNLNITANTSKDQFPPKPPSKKLLHRIVSDFVADTSPSSFVEAGCAACGQLTRIKHLKHIKSLRFSLDPLKSQDGLTRLECKTL